MSNLPENENIKENLNDTPGEENLNSDEFSTVFSDPTEHRKKTPSNKKKSRLPVIISVVLAVAVLAGGTVAVYKLIPEKEEDTTSSVGLDTVNVLDLKSEDLKTVTVANKSGTFRFYSEKEESKASSTSSSDTSSSTTVTNWYVDGYDKTVTSSAAVSRIVSSVASIDAVREITLKTSAECGLDNPVSKVDIVSSDDAEISVFVGSQSPDNSGTYLKLSTSDKIYVVDEATAEAVDFDVLSLANTESIPGITVTGDMSSYKGEDGTLSSFDSMTVTGNNFPEALIITPNTDPSLSKYAKFMTTAPTKRIADNVDTLFNVFKSGLTVSGAYSFDTSAATVSKLGLDKPDFAATVKIGNFTRSYKFRLQEDGGYAVLCDDSKMIKKVDASSLAFIDYKASDFYSSFVCLQTLSDLSNFTIKTADKTYSFDIQYDGTEGAKEPYVINYNGTKLTAENFQNFYQYCISLSCSDYTVDKVSGEPDLSIVFTYSDTSKAAGTVEFRKVSETKYQYSIDGIQMGKINSSDFNKIEKYAAKIADGGSIN